MHLYILFSFFVVAHVCKEQLNIFISIVFTIVIVNMVVSS